MKQLFKTPLNHRLIRARLASTRQTGFSLIELLIVLAVISVLGGIAAFGNSVYNDTVGEREGRALQAAATCGIGIARSTPITSVTVAGLVNSNCIDAAFDVTNKGQATAAATTKASGAALTWSAVSIGGTNDAGQVGTSLQRKHCQSAVEYLSNARAARIRVTPNGGAQVVVLNSGTIDFNANNLGLATQCGGAEPIAVDVAFTR